MLGSTNYANTMATKVAERQTTINSLKKDLNATIKAAGANALMVKKNAEAGTKEADANALRAKQTTATAVGAERAVSIHNLRNIKKLHDGRLIGPKNYTNIMAAKVEEGRTTINFRKKYFNITIKAADTNALMTKQNPC